MRNGDAYKIRTLSGTGLSDSEICKHFRGKYTLAEVRKYIPKKAAAVETAENDAPTEATEAVEAPERKAKPKRKARKKAS